MGRWGENFNFFFSPGSGRRTREQDPAGARPAGEACWGPNPLEPPLYGTGILGPSPSRLPGSAFRLERERGARIPP